jgi:5-hydroxyisourate hydrolase-like protein (transthyretin family)
VIVVASPFAPPAAAPRAAASLIVQATLALTVVAAALLVGTTSALATGTITGTVTDASSGAMLPTVKLTLLHYIRGEDPNMPWMFAGETWTSPAWDPWSPPQPFTFTVEPGRYKLKAEDTTGIYAGQWWKGKAQFTTADRIDLADGAVFDASVAMTLAGHVAGIVTDREGAPLAGVDVRAFPADERSTDFMQGATTQANGSFRITGLSPGKYILSFSPRDPHYLHQFWPDQTFAEKATPVAVSAGQTTALDAALSRAAWIVGKVTSRFGVPLRTVTVQACRLATNGEPVTVASNGEAVDHDGTYRILGLRPGRYYLRFRWYDRDMEYRRKAMWYLGTFFCAQATRVQVAEGQILEGIDMTLWGDALPPVTDAPTVVAVRSGSVAKIKYRVRDAQPGGPTADVTIKLKTAQGRTVRMLRLSRQRVNRWLTCRLRCNVPRSTYRYIVYAVDSGANPQMKAGSNLLVVK